MANVSFQLSGFSLKQMNLNGSCVSEKWFRLGSHEEYLGVHFQSDSHGFRLSIPSYCQLFIENKTLWTESEETNLKQIEFHWENAPRELKILFPNGEALIANPQSRSIWDELKSHKILSCILGAIILHAFFLGFSTSSIIHSIESYHAQKQRIADISKIQTQLARDSDGLLGTPSQRQMTATKRLLDSWGVGKRVISSADQILKPTRFDRAFQNGASSKTSLDSWALDEEGAELGPLGISESQILEALHPIQPYLEDCYNDVLILDPEHKGRPRINLWVTAQGKIHDVNIFHLTGSTNSVQKLRQCFLSAFRKAKIPVANRDYEVARTLILSH